MRALWITCLIAGVLSGVFGILSGVLGFSGVAGAATNIAWLLSVAFSGLAIVLLAIALVVFLISRKPAQPAL